MPGPVASVSSLSVSSIHGLSEKIVFNLIKNPR